MEKMNDLKDLLKHEIMDIASAEQQIIDALPAMIEKASNDQLKNALSDHLRVTQQQKTRIEKVQQLLAGGEEQQEDASLLTRLFKSNVKCRAMKGILEEGQKMMGEDMSPEVMDAAIIACAQKVEHYEITSYGTVRTWSRELGLEQVTRLLEETLQEEYQADDLLTALAESRINQQAENGSGKQSRAKASSPTASSATTQPARERASRRVEELEPVSASRTSAGTGSKRATGTPASGKSSPVSRSTGRSASSGSSTSRTAGASSRSTGSAGRSISSKSSGTSSRSTSSGGRGSNANAGRNKSR